MQIPVPANRVRGPCAQDLVVYDVSNLGGEIQETEGSLRNQTGSRCYMRYALVV